jgi:purine-binding chemotaxis protein CheW
MRGDETTTGSGARDALVTRLRTLEGELQRAQSELLAIGGAILPGLHLVVEAGGARGLLPTSRVSEVVRLVATAPLAGAPPHVLGTFVCRGTPVLAVDLAAVLGFTREPPLDAQIVILAGTPSVGLVVDRIERLVDGPRVFAGDAAGRTHEAWRGAGLVAGLCVDGGDVLPVVDASPVLAGLAGLAGPAA